MAKILKTSGIATNLVSLLMVDDDDVIKEFVTSTALTNTGVTLTTSAETFGGASVKGMVVSTGSITLNTPPTVQLSGPLTVYMACTAHAGNAPSAVIGFADDTSDIYGTNSADTHDTFRIAAVDRGVGVTNATRWATGTIKFSAGHTYVSNGTSRFLYGEVGSAGGFDGDPYTMGNLSSYPRQLTKFFQTGAGSRQFVGTVLCVAVFNTQLSQADFQSLHADFVGTLFQGGLKLKVLVHPDATGDSSVDGIVFAAPSGVEITGAKIGEFTNKTFEATLESGQAVLKVPVGDFGGASLSTSDTPVALVRNTIDTTGIIPCTVIQE